MKSATIKCNVEQHGFTVIELVTVIAIIGILAAIAIPSYTSYIERSQITEGLIVSEGIRSEIGIYVWENKHFPNVAEVATTGNIGMQANAIDGKYVATHGVSVTANTGVITVNFDSGHIAGEMLILTPDINSANSQQIVKWVCSGTVVTDNLPSSCQD